MLGVAGVIMVGLRTGAVTPAGAVASELFDNVAVLSGGLWSRPASSICICMF